MASVPTPDSVTICEINRTLVVADSIEVADDKASDTYGKVLKLVFSPIPFQAELYEAEGNSHITSENCSRRRLSFSLLASAFDYLRLLFKPDSASLLTAVDIQRTSWHQQKHILAFISGTNQVTIHNYEDPEGKDTCVLNNEFQRDINAIEWRPNGGRTLAVACRGGICIWSLSFPGNAASVRPSTVPLGNISRGSGMRWILSDFLRCHHGEKVSTMSWSPNGRYLALGSCESSEFYIWDVAQGIGTPIRRGLGAVSLLKWSPLGDYFLVAKFDGNFYLWETNTWTSEPWFSSSGFITGATWDPDGRMLLVAFSESSTLGTIHFSTRTLLGAHMLPVSLPEMGSHTGSQRIDKMAWDCSGERLALSCKGADGTYDGLVSIYDVRRAPLLSMSLVGFVRGPGVNPKPMALSFHNKFKQGPLLTVCWSSGFCCTYPLLYRYNFSP